MTQPRLCKTVIAVVSDQELTGRVNVSSPILSGAWQQCTSGLSVTNQSCYELSGGCFTTFGFEYKPGFDEGYITWYNNNERAWTLYAAAMVGDQATEIDVRPIPLEPMVCSFWSWFYNAFGDADQC